MVAPECIVIDFETEAIERRPNYPPRPVGCAFGFPGEETVYETDPAAAQDRLWCAWDSGLPILCHNAKFDLSVAYEALGMAELPWQRVHDTMFLAYLCDPHARSLGLKPLAADLLGWAPEERNELDDWIWSHRRELEAQYGGKVSKTKLGAWIHAAPAALVGPYACGDVARARALFEHLWPIVQRVGMGEAYDRERRLLPILMENERLGLRVDMEGLERDVAAFDRRMETAETWLRAELRASGLNFDADRDVAAVLLERGIVPKEAWSLTKSGQMSTSKENLLPEHFTDPRIASALGYRNRLKTCLETFMHTWLAQGRATGGTIHPNWNQTRGERGGTRTGRPSCTDPNLLNLSKDFDAKKDGYVHPEFLGVARLPLVRKYVLPDEGHTWVDIDFSGQEMRCFAHFEQGALWRAYHDNPALDPHEWLNGIIIGNFGRDLGRTRVKNVNFGRLYGGGEPAIYRQAKCKDRNEAREIMRIHDAALPGRRLVVDEITRIVRRGDPVRTWGGRLYYPEAPGADGRSKEYRLINYVCGQGSAADLTKQAMIDWYADPRRDARFMVQVYDEIAISARSDIAFEQMLVLREVMEAQRLSVPMRSDCAWGPNWGTLEECEPAR